MRTVRPPSLPLVLAMPLLCLCLSASPTWAQSGSKANEELSDAERARRDAARVFNFIKFHTVRPAAAQPAPAPAPARPATRSAAAPAPTTAAGSTAAAGEPAAEASPASPPPSRSLTLAAGAASAAEPALTTADLPATDLARPSETALAPAPVVEPEEVPLRLIAYVPPDMNAQVLAAIPGNEIAVPVRFVVQPDGRVSSAQSRGVVPRRIAQAAMRAVQQWRFDPIPAVREVDVEIAFKAGE
ncbi:TonB family protein [Inhella sp.]|uniref:TonB family protein n=1 Tax=Inhella sp. TaxID=1921806 RepID=UPI0035AEE0B2